jgi:hypothetical protein
MSALTMSEGLLESSGGTIKFAHDQTSKFTGNAFVMLDETLLTSDDGIGIAFIEIDGEPDLSMTDSSQISYITLSTTSDTSGSISTAGGVDCLNKCTGFLETGAYGFNTHGLYRKVTSANWMLSESSGERKTATLAVKLLSRPLENVEVILSSSDLSEATLDKYLLSFTPSTWNRVQEVTITGEDDDVVDNNKPTVENFLDTITRDEISQWKAGETLLLNGKILTISKVFTFCFYVFKKC